MPSRLHGFTHLQVHSHFTLLGGTAPVDELAARAAAEGMTHLALTDTNALYGAVAFDRACREAGVNPILGMTVTVAPPGDRLGAATAPGRLVLLATGPAGYRSLCRLSSSIQADPQREALAARGLSWDDLEAHREGLVCLGGGRMGWVERLLRAGEREAAARYAARLAGIYGQDGYLSLEIHQPEDRPIVEEMAALGRRVGLRPVAVQPIIASHPPRCPACACWLPSTTTSRWRRFPRPPCRQTVTPGWGSTGSAPARSRNALPACPRRCPMSRR